MTLTGRVAVVTGASQGIGRACALKLAKCGASVALLARNRVKLEEATREIQNISHPNSDSDHGGTGVPARADSSDRGGTGALARAYVAVADIENEDQIKAASKSINAELGTTDILVNRTGIT